MPDEDAVSQQDECVVLAHGLWRSNLAMLPLEWSLTDAGYGVVNVDYDSTSKSLSRLAEEDLRPAIARCESMVDGPVHLVTHSMGGIIARTYLQGRTLPRGGRLVMLSPPNQGSVLVSRFEDWPLARHILGPAGLELSQASDSPLRNLEPLTVDVGVIAGTSNSPWTAWVPHTDLPQPHDGTVSVESTFLPEMRDFRAVDANHVSIRHSEEVFQLIRKFLETASFSGEGAVPPHDEQL
ncbi:alpha/beta fold hydrolase [Marinobacter sp. CHS3-4]|uniref:alpha/beta fold hydrolase n=1 Tax=Marinobacter sp. CHS3-4 TaxID=3045174 RepID=UPI0024B54DA0|nr:alpha/beta fold hydrolase [Marinobacter sp. CHS3-4]MDI9245319.1 alpha/beta fold hydrolase [Marinobacter sp. CHS3-4]